MSTDVTPALRWAATLRALAAHLTRYPHLAGPYSMYLDWIMLYTDSGATLLAWADTLTDPAITVQAIKGEAYVHLTGMATVDTVVVVCVVHGFLSVLGRLDDGQRPVDLDVLRRFVAEQAS
ncbi:MAG TPA: hypothetical protein VGL06_04000 [Pseudonocardiaceae bacterium]|jgi:hypothetical protein